jgi:DNA-binding HxlR family transcriptional regulator
MKVYLQGSLYQEKQKSRYDEKNLLAFSKWFLPGAKFAQCSIKTSLGVLGKKWTLLLMRDIGFAGVDRFNRFLDTIPGLTPRVLSMRLKELEKEGFIECVENEKSPMIVRWALTEKGRDVLPILMLFTAFGSKWHADVVFEDNTPRAFDELFQPNAIKIIWGYIWPASRNYPCRTAIGMQTTGLEPRN